MTPGTVLVTGATGFLGRAVVRELAQGGMRVHALVRAGSEGDVPLAADVVRHAGELRDQSSLERAARALSEADPDAWVVHSAALISYRTPDRAAQHEVNVEGTRRLLAAMGRSGLRRLLLVGSVVCVGTAPDAHSVLDEDAEWNLAGARSAYADTKRAQELLCREAAADGSLELRTVLPGAIFGASPRPSNTARFVEQVRRRGAPLLVPPGSLGVVGLEDVASGVHLALERGRSGGRYLLVESSHRLVDAFTLVARCFDASPPRGTLPPLAWRAIVAGARGLDRLRPLDLLAPEALVLLGRHFRFDARRAREELGWRPEAFEEVLRGMT